MLRAATQQRHQVAPALPARVKGVGNLVFAQIAKHAKCQLEGASPCVPALCEPSTRPHLPRLPSAMALVLLVVAVTLCAASSVRVERLATNTPAELSIVVAAPPLRRSSAGRYVTLALPPGVTVTAVEVVERSVGGGYGVQRPLPPLLLLLTALAHSVRPTDAGVMGPQYLDCRSIRCPELPVPLAVGDPRRALGDTGLYFSEAPSTRPRGPVGSSPWDDIQSSRAEALGVVAVVSNVGPQWVGTLSPVAGLETYYSHAWDGSRFEAGPWQRIACAGARIAGSAPVQPLAKASQGRPCWCGGTFRFF